MARIRPVIILFTFFALFNSLAHAQQGGIAGAVTDAITGRELVGVVVTLKPGGRQDNTDVEGRFLFSGLAPGVYSLEFREMNHITTYIPVLRVTANEITVLTVAMYDSLKSLSGVLITARKPRQENTAGVAIERKSSAQIMDGLAQDVIRRTPDRTTAEALRRISGVTLQDNKYPVVRGLADRYNMALLNGVPLPSALPDKKSFSFDVIPSGLIDNIMIVKTGAPEMPGEFAGAVIRVNTRDIPDESVQTLTFGTAFHTNSVFRDAQWQQADAWDKLGFGGQSRALPSGMPNSVDYMNTLTKAERATFSKKFKNDWVLDSRSMTPGLQFQYSNSARFLFAGKETGGLIALSYSSLPRYNSIVRQEYNTGGMTRDYTEDQFTRNVLWGLIGNFSMKLNKYSKLSWRNLFSNNTDEVNNIREGVNYELGTWQRAYAMNYIQNYFYSTQLAGDHFFRQSGMKFQWNGGLQFVYRNTPDYRRLLYTRPYGDSLVPLTAAVGPARNLTNAGKLYTAMHENVQFAGYSLSKSWFTDNFKSDLKVGGFHSLKSRQFNARVLAIVENNFSVPDSLKQLGVGSIFSPDNMGGDGFRYDEIYDPSYSYSGRQSLHAGYIQTDNIIDRLFRISGGLRVEKFYQRMETYRPGNLVNQITPTLDELNILPSVAFTVLASNRTNVRFAYASTVSRPDFREISPFSFFDFVNFVSVTGNDTLKSCRVNNFDVRFETFPGDGQSLSIGAFVKSFRDPIEQVVNPVVLDGNRSISFQNAREAVVYGLEAEFRLKLRKLGKVFRNFQLFGNAALMNSEVKLGSESRQMQGQAPYSVNTGILFAERKKGVSFSLNYNVVGPRIMAVGTVNYPDFYEIPRHVVDLQVSKSFGKRAELKFNAGDLLAQDYVVYQNTDQNKNYSDKDRAVTRMKTAPLLILTYTYRLN